MPVDFLDAGEMSNAPRQRVQGFLRAFQRPVGIIAGHCRWHDGAM